MIRALSAAVAALLLTGSALAKDAPSAPITITPAKSGAIKFNHKSHKDVQCAKCHGEGEPAKITPLEQKAAHALCVDCHKTQAAAATAANKAPPPVKCDGCHAKKTT